MERAQSEENCCWMQPYSQVSTEDSPSQEQLGTITWSVLDCVKLWTLHQSHWVAWVSLICKELQKLKGMIAGQHDIRVWDYIWSPSSPACISPGCHPWPDYTILHPGRKCKPLTILSGVTTINPISVVAPQIFELISCLQLQTNSRHFIGWPCLNRFLLPIINCWNCGLHIAGR